MLQCFICLLLYESKSVDEEVAQASQKCGNLFLVFFLFLPNGTHLTQFSICIDAYATSVRWDGVRVAQSVLPYVRVDFEHSLVQDEQDVFHGLHSPICVERGFV